MAVRAGPQKSWAPKKWIFRIVVLEKTHERLLDCKEIKPVNPKGNQPWILIGRTDVETEALILRLPDAKSWLIGKDPDTRKDWRQQEKRAAEDKLITYHYELNGHEFEQTLGDSEGQGSLAWKKIHGVAKSRTQLSDWTTTTLLHLMSAWYIFIFKASFL